MVLELITKEKSYDITNIVTKYSWSGSVEQASRSLEFSVVNAPFDENLNDLPRIDMGNFIKLYDDNKKPIYYGMVYNAERTSNIGDISYTSYDLLYHFTKSSWCKNFKNVTPETVIATCCSEVGVPVGKLSSTGVNLEKLIIENETLYDTILLAYQRASEITGKQYFVTMNIDKLESYEKGKNSSLVILSDDNNITKSSIKESITDIVNRVKIYDGEDNQNTGMVSDSESLSKYGVFQATYTKEEGVEPNSGAKSNLKGPSQNITIEGVGDLSAKSGYSISISDGATGLTGKYWIIDDKHNFENGAHTMSLTLSFKGI